MTEDWRQALVNALGCGVRRWQRLSGGDSAQSWCASLDDGRRVFVKTHRTLPANAFTTEAAGLAWLRDAGCVDVPAVLTVSDSPALLALEWIESGSSRGAGESAFGRALAALHQAGAATFGRQDCRPTGSLGVPNNPTDTWPDFYAECRLLPLARIARDRQVLSASDVQAVERLAGSLAQRGAADESACRLHGDLWAGNRLIDSKGRSWLIDPAAHGGHREFDLAMMRLFGGFGEAVFRAYDEAFPLQPGAADRVGLHQLAPLIVHAIKFGGSYIAATRRILDDHA